MKTIITIALLLASATASASDFFDSIEHRCENRIKAEWCANGLIDCFLPSIAPNEFTSIINPESCRDTFDLLKLDANCQHRIRNEWCISGLFNCFLPSIAPSEFTSIYNPVSCKATLERLQSEKRGAGVCAITSLLLSEVE
jgi:hypothetical protein